MGSLSLHPLNLPNLLTLARILAAGVLFSFGLGRRWDLAFPLFCAAAATDMIDGTLARLLRQRTRLGAFLDPMADKLLMLAGFLTLTLDHLLPWGLTAVVIGRDLLIVIGLVILKYRRVAILYRPTYLSKLTTFGQILTVFAAMGTAPSLPFSLPFREGLPALLAATGGLTVITTVQYFRIGWRMLNQKGLEASCAD